MAEGELPVALGINILQFKHENQQKCFPPPFFFFKLPVMAFLAEQRDCQKKVLEVERWLDG